jgi:ATP-dependent DNA helicase RecG
MELAAQAKRRLAYEEIFNLQLHWLGKKKAQDARGIDFTHATFTANEASFINALPFELTGEQLQSIADIRGDLQKPEQMKRMLLGDVGTGKTVVAAAAVAALAGERGAAVQQEARQEAQQEVQGEQTSRETPQQTPLQTPQQKPQQVALMAPTEVLAQQHFAKLNPVFESIGIAAALLTSSTPQAEKDKISTALKEGKIDLIIGTHALIEDYVQFENLALVIIDEQHRFGVNQREKLISKGTSADILYMTATPIPRSLALTIYGDIELSYIMNRPHSGAGVETIVLNKASHHIAYEAIREAVEAGHQAIIVTPLIEKTQDGGGKEQDGSDAASAGQGAGESAAAAAAYAEESASPELVYAYIDFDNDDSTQDLKAARQEFEYLSKQVFPQYKMGLLTGPAPASEKREVMSAFAQGEIDILVATTVIEVGIDVPNATVVVVEDAERFGLSQLHQLRGRVGRGEYLGKAYLMANTLSRIAEARMNAVAATNDGFKLAEYDLEQRKEGDIMGIKQHGLPTLKLVNVIRDKKMIEVARKDAINTLSEREQCV